MGIFSSFNQDSIRLVMMSFEFWIKVGYTTLYTVIAFWYNTHWDDGGIPYYLGVTDKILSGIVRVSFVFGVAAFDALPRLQRRWKFLWSFVGALWWTMMSVQWQFLAPNTLDYVIPIEATGSAISMHALLAGWTRIIALFLGKQSINLYRRKGKCISITYTPYISWKEENQSYNNKRAPSKKTRVSLLSSYVDVESEIEAKSPEQDVEC